MADGGAHAHAGARDPARDGVVHGLVREHFGAFSERMQEGGRALPRYVVAEFGSVVAAILAHARNVRDSAMFMLLYGAGLRVSEMLALTAKDIDSQRMVLHVRDTKNRHDRIVPLPPSALEALRTYWRESRPKGPRLFGSPHRIDRGHPLTRVAVHKSLRLANTEEGKRLG